MPLKNNMGGNQTLKIFEDLCAVTHAHLHMNRNKNLQFVLMKDGMTIEIIMLATGLQLSFLDPHGQETGAGLMPLGAFEEILDMLISFNRLDS